MALPRDLFVRGGALGRWQTNCLAIGDRNAGVAVVVDPGEGGTDWVPRVMEREGVRCEAILLTHGHLDHLWSAPELAEQLDVPVLLHPDDRWLWRDPSAGFGQLPPDTMERLLGRPWKVPDERLEDLADRAKLTCGALEIEAVHTPGHTPGHVTFLVHGLSQADLSLHSRDLDAPREVGVLVSGDLLFRDSVGRTDFPRGSWEQLLESIERTVLPLEDDTLVLPGHGPETTVGRERRRNPFLSDLVGRS